MWSRITNSIRRIIETIIGEFCIAFVIIILVSFAYLLILGLTTFIPGLRQYLQLIGIVDFLFALTALCMVVAHSLLLLFKEIFTNNICINEPPLLEVLDTLRKEAQPTKNLPFKAGRRSIIVHAVDRFKQRVNHTTKAGVRAGFTVGSLDPRILTAEERSA